jgi:hypothetical protein
MYATRTMLKYLVLKSLDEIHVERGKFQNLILLQLYDIEANETDIEKLHSRPEMTTDIRY